MLTTAYSRLTSKTKRTKKFALKTKRSKQNQISLFTHGGRRKGAGRPNRSGARAYTERPAFTARTPLHVTFRLRKGQPSLRTNKLFQTLRRAIERSQRHGLLVVHYAILSNHVHLIVETTSKKTLERGMKSLLISLGKQLSRFSVVRADERLVRRKEPRFFDGRYHAHVLQTPTEVKHALRYVLFNDEKHRSRKLIFNPCKNNVPFIPHSPYVSTFAFRDWPTLLGRILEKKEIRLLAIPAASESIRIGKPQSWLLKVGWKQAKTL